MKSFKYQTNGFTLIEMLVAVALFSIVLMIAMGSIMTIVDVNRKSQSLTTVMNDLNFSLENMTRTITTGKLISPDDVDGSDDFESITVENQDEDEITFAWEDTTKTITRKKNDEPAYAFTSEQINIDALRFRVFSDDNNKQPRILIMVKGTAETSKTISSSFIIQTTASQRDLRTDRFD